MGELMMVEKETPVLDELDLPLFYMNDYSVLGLVVDQLPEALKVLQANGFHVARRQSCARIRFQTRKELHEVFDTLSRHQVSFGTADLVSQAYQG